MRQTAFSRLIPRNRAPGSSADTTVIGIVVEIMEPRQECHVAIVPKFNQPTGGWLRNVPYPRGADIRLADEVVIIFGDSELKNPRIVAVYNHRNVELNPITSAYDRHYVSDKAVGEKNFSEAEKKRVTEFIHEFVTQEITDKDGTKEVEDPFTVKRASWFRVIKTGEITFVHAEDYEDPSDFEEKDLFWFRINEDGSLEVKLASTGGKITGQGASVEWGPEGDLAVDAPENKVTINAKTATITASDVQLEAKGKATVKGDEVHVEARSVTVTATEVAEVRAPSVKIGPGSDGKNVVVEGAKIPAHDHTVVVDGDEYTTSMADDLRIEEAGQSEVKVG